MKKENKEKKVKNHIIKSIEEFEKTYFPKSYEKKLYLETDPKILGEKLADEILKKVGLRVTANV